MAVDVTLATIGGGYNRTTINDNFAAIEAALADALSRSGNSPNQMTADIDMNGNNLLNVGSLGLANDVGLQDFVDWAEEWANKAEDSLVSTAAGGDGVDDYSALHHAAKSSASASAALTSETNAATSETNAATSETNAAASAVEAADSVSSVQLPDPAVADTMLIRDSLNTEYEAKTDSEVRTFLSLGTASLEDVGVDSGDVVQVDQSETGTASASTVDLTSSTLQHTITGTTTITAFTGVAGVRYELVFSDALTLTHNASSLILPGGTNITTAAGDQAEVYMITGSTCRVKYTKANGEAVVSSASSGLPAPDFVSSEQTITNDTILNVAHGLGSTPTLVSVILRCKTADLGYSVGDEVIAGIFDRQSSADKGVVIYKDATNVTLVQGSAQALLSRSTFNSTSITNSNWRWEVRAWS